jgi:hypothetical protein
MQFGDLGRLCGVEKFTDPRHVRDGNLVQSERNGRKACPGDSPAASSSVRWGVSREYLGG